METKTNCDICHTGKYISIFSIAEYTYKRCDVCGFIKKMPNVCEFDYSSSYQSADRLNYSKQLAENYFKRINPKIGPNKICLEIGGSFGFFCQKLQEKKQCCVRNVEPSLFAADYANSLGIKTVNDLNKLDIKQFDYIFSFHVIEHIEAIEVKNFIIEAMKLLKPNGIFYLFTPNASSLGLNFLGKYWAWIAHKEHLNFLTETSFRYLVNNEVTITEQVPAFAHYPYPSFISFIRKKMFKTDTSPVAQNNKNNNHIILVLKRLFHFSMMIERILFYPIYRLFNIFTSHYDELVIEVRKKN